MTGTPVPDPLAVADQIIRTAAGRARLDELVHLAYTARTAPAGSQARACSAATLLNRLHHLHGDTAIALLGAAVTRLAEYRREAEAILARHPEPEEIQP